MNRSEEDFGFSFVESSIKLEQEKIKTSEEISIWKGKCDKILAMIMPLLDNLAKNPEKDIHWPNRDEKIQAFKRKLMDISK